MTALHGLRAVFMRGGTSKALMFHRRDLPARQEDWAPIFLAAMGAPDPNGRQLDGMGGGVSSLSKVCVVGPSTRADADIDYTFAQVLVKDARVDYSANCGNMSSAMGPFAVDEGLDRLAASWAEQRKVPQVAFALERRLGARAGFRRNEQMLGLAPRYLVAFAGNGVLERLVVQAKEQGVAVVDRRGPLGTHPKRAAREAAMA